MSATTLAMLAPLWARYAQLQAYMLSARGRLSLTPGATTAGLPTLQNLVDRLGPNGTSGESLMRGSLTPAQWLAQAKTAWDGITAQLEESARNNPYSRAWEELVIPTAQEFAAETRANVDAFREGAVPALIALAVIFVAFTVLRVSR